MSPPFRLGPTQFAVACAVMLATVLIAWAVDPTWYWTLRCEGETIPRASSVFGFVGRWDDGGFTIVDVTDDGAFAHAGFQAGDVPVARHHGFFGFCSALEKALDGAAATVSVVNDAREAGWRSLTIEPPR